MATFRELLLLLLVPYDSSSTAFVFNIEHLTGPVRRFVHWARYFRRRNVLVVKMIKDFPAINLTRTSLHAAQFTAANVLLSVDVDTHIYTHTK